jgi:hypothetical protein
VAKGDKQDVMRAKKLVKSGAGDPKAPLVRGASGKYSSKDILNQASKAAPKSTSATKPSVASKANAKNKAKVDKYNSPASQAQRAKESLTKNPQALKTKTPEQMTPKQKSAAMAKEQAKAVKNRAAFAKMKAQGAKIGSSPTSGYGKSTKPKGN